MSTIKKLLAFVIIWVTNSILLYVAFSLYPLNFVLGNFRFGAIPSALWSGFAWTFITWLFKPVISKFNIKLNGLLMKSAFYLAANFVAIWITARMAPVTGFGVSSFTYVLGLAVVAEIAQLAVWNIVVPLLGKK